MPYRNLVFAGLVLLSFLFLTADVLLAQETKPFRVDSYIPLRFFDRMWTVAGSGSYGDNHSSSDDKALLNGPLWYHKEESSSKLSNAMLETSFFEQYYTVPRFVQGGISIEGHYTHENRSGLQWFEGKDDYYGPDVTYRVGRINARETDKHLSFWVTPSISAGQYVKSDVFLSGRAWAELYYSHIPEESQSSTQVDSTYYVDQGSRLWRDSSDLNSGGDARSNRIGGEVLAGYGRVYSGAFAATALYIIEELRGRGELKREPRYEEMVGLADTIYQYRQRHALDERLRRQEVLSAIVSFLVAQGITVPLSPQAHFAIEDVWDYFPVSFHVFGYTGSQYITYDARQFGYRLQAGFGHSYRFESRSTSGDRLYFYRWVFRRTDGTDSLEYVIRSQVYNRTKIQSETPYFTAQAEYYKPISLRWQLDGILRYIVYLEPWTRSTHSLTTSDSSTYNSQQQYVTDRGATMLSLQSHLGYLVDSRTYLSVFGVIQYTKANWRSTLKDLDQSFPQRFVEEETGYQLSADILYRVSIPTTLRFTLTWNRNLPLYSEWVGYYNYQDNRQFGVSAGFTHYIY